MGRSKISAKALCRSGVIAALYVVFTISFGSFSFFGGMQLRPSEGLCLLPLFYPEAVLALTAGCLIANLFSPFVLFDVTAGTLATLVAAVCTYLIGKRLPDSKKWLWVKIAIGGIFPVLFNAAVVPLIVLLSGDGTLGAITGAAYFAVAWEVAVSETIWVYAVGTPLVIFCARQRAKNNPVFSSGSEKPTKNTARSKENGLNNQTKD